MDEHYFNNKHKICFSKHLLSIFYKIDNINNIMDEILLQDFDNHDLMKFLQHQDELLSKIIDQNEEIIKLLKGGQ